MPEIVQDQDSVEIGASRPVAVVSYGYSTQTELGVKDSPWQNASVTFSIPLVDGENPEDIAAEWMTKSKAFVLAELGIEVALTDDGLIQPSVKMPEKPAKRSGGGGGNARQSDADKYGTVVVDGETLVDYRAAKAADEKPKLFPDFKTPDGKTSYWIKTRDGELTDEKFREFYEETVSG